MMPGVLRTAMGVYVLEADTCLSRWIEQQGRLDIQMNVDEVRAYAHLVPDGGVVINAGACLGDHAVIYSQLVGPSGHVHAFEPHPLTCDALRSNMARLSNVTVYPHALGDAAVARWITAVANVGASYLSDDGLYPVMVFRLDQFLLPELHRCDLLHLDAEGSEPAILNGARTLIERFRPAIVIEVQDGHLRRAGSSEAALLSQLEALGYGVSAIAGQATSGERDVLALPRERAA